uniref:Free fatty acid receptor 1 n=1 Tax=Mustela putorius furo TaxID=9669 RepID=M3Y6I9_MUSPF
RRKLRAAWVAGGALLTLLLCLGPYNASNGARKQNGDALMGRVSATDYVTPKSSLLSLVFSLLPSPRRQAHTSDWLPLLVYLFTFIVGLPLNMMALVIFVGKLRRRPVAVDVLLLNLTLSDLLLLLFLPFRMVEAASAMRWPLPLVFCPLSGFLFFTTIYLTSLFLTTVSIERFLSVAYPIWYKARPRPGQASLVSGACWLLASAHCSVVYVTEFSGNSSYSQTTNSTCYLEFEEAQLALLLPVRLEMAVVLFGVPLLITSYCYGRLVWVLSRGTNHRRKRRVVGLVAATLLNFLVCFGPYNVSHVVGYIKGESPAWRSYVLLLSTLNSCVDPLVYYFSSSGFQ